MLPDVRTLLILALASVIIVPWIVCLVLQAADNPRDEDADRQRLIVNRVGRVPLAPGSTRFAPGTGCAVSALTGDDPSRGTDAASDFLLHAAPLADERQQHHVR